MSLGLVVVLMGEARDPSNWQWLSALDSPTNGRPAASDPGWRPEIDNRLKPSDPDEQIPGTIVSPAPPQAEADTSGNYFPGVKPQYLKSVRDDTTFRYDERQAWFNLLDVLQKTDQATLRKASTGRVTFSQFYNQSAEYRGELVTVEGTVRRAHLLKAPKNDCQIEQYYQIWLQPADNRSVPMVVYCLLLPDGFPTGMDVSANVEITGFHFKRWAYKAQDAIRTTPVLLARTVRREDGRTATGRSAIEKAAWPESPVPKPDELHSGPTLQSEPTPEPPAATALDSRELLRRHGVDDSHFENLIEGQPVDDNEAETLLKVMYWVCDFRTADVARWASPELDPVELAEDPEPSRGRFFFFSGRVTKVEPRRPLAEMIERLSFDEYYRCEFQLAGQNQPLVIFAREVPHQWRQGEAVDEPASSFGLFLKCSAEDSRCPVPVFVAQRIAWHPDTVLGNLGMDMGLFDEVENRKRLLASEREAFYQMLAAVGRAKPGQLLAAAEKDLKRDGKDSFPVFPLFMKPQSRHGRLVALSGTVRRVVRIRVKEPDIVERFGIDHYYEMALFTDDSEDNPLFFCVRRLPEGMPTGEGPEFAEHVRIAGFFFKLRLYRIVPHDTEDPSARGQLAPLLFAREPVWYPQEKPVTNDMVQAVAGGLFVLVLLGVWLGVWRYGRGDRRFHEQTFAKAHNVDSGISLNEIELRADDTPDFTRLEEMDRGLGQR